MSMLRRSASHLTPRRRPGRWPSPCFQAAHAHVLPAPAPAPLLAHPTLPPTAAGRLGLTGPSAPGSERTEASGTSPPGGAWGALPRGPVALGARSRLWAQGRPAEPAASSAHSFFLRLCSEVPILEDTLMRVLVIGLSRELPLGPADAMELADHLVKRAAAVQADGRAPRAPSRPPPVPTVLLPPAVLPALQTSSKAAEGGLPQFPPAGWPHNCSHRPRWGLRVAPPLPSGALPVLPCPPASESEPPSSRPPASRGPSRAPWRPLSGLWACVSDVDVLKVERVQLLDAVLNLCTYHHPENIQLPPG